MSSHLDDVRALEKRLDRLARQAARAKVIAVVALLLVVASWLPAIAHALFGGHPWISASAIDLYTWPGDHFALLREGNGALFGGVKNNYGELTVYRFGRRRTDVDLTDDGLSVVLYDEANRRAAQWTVTRDGARFEKLAP
jgi:hypothetical protein